MQPSGRIFDTTYPKLEQAGKWLLNYARNANNPTPVASAITMKKAECAETIGVNEVAQPRNEPSRNEEE
jgi:hypothetical protein